MKHALWAISLAAAGAAYSVPITVGHTANELASTMVGSGITVSNAVYHGTAAANGIYTGSTVEAQGNANLTSGIVLSSGSAGALGSGTNTSDVFSQQNASGGDADLLSLIPGYVVKDAASLEFDFVAEGTGVTTASFWYIFGSEEYNEYVNTNFNDVFGFFLNGTNVAVIPGTSTPVSINTVNGGYPFGTDATHPELFVNNDLSDGALLGTEMDGFTVPLFVQFDVMAGVTNHLKLGIADAGDQILDSWVMIGGGSFNNTPAVPSVPEPSGLALMGFGSLGLIGLGAASRRRPTDG
jgi:hypothetical protein